MPAIVALVKIVPDFLSEKKLAADFTVDRTSGPQVLDEISLASLERALRLKESYPEADYRVVAVAMGPENIDEGLRKALAMGADEAIHIQDEALAGSDVYGTARTLAAAIGRIGDVALVVAGAGSSDGETLTTPGVVAEYLELPALTFLFNVEINGDTLTGMRGSPEGMHVLETTLPAVVSVTDRGVEPRFPNFKSMMAAKKAEVPVWTLADLGISPEEVGHAGAVAVVTDAVELPPRQGGEVIVSDDPEETARTIVDFLADRKLV